MSDNVEMKTTHLGKRRSRSPSSTAVSARLAKKDTKRQEYETYGLYDWREVLMDAIYKATNLPTVLVAMIVEDVPDTHEDWYSGMSGILVFGRREGCWARHHLGKTLWSDMYVNGRLHGMSTEYGENGVIRRTIPRVNGTRHGICTDYYANGRVFCTTEWVHNQRHGDERYYDSDGRLEQIIVFRRGILQEEITM